MTLRNVILGTVLVPAALLACSSTPESEPEPPPAPGGPHGGRITATEEFHFETVFRTDGIVVCVYGEDEAPVDPSGVSGEVRFEDGAPAPFAYRPAAGAGAGHLFAPASGLDGGSVSIHLEGLPGREEKSASYTQVVIPARNPRVSSARSSSGSTPPESVPSSGSSGRARASWGTSSGGHGHH